MKRNTTKNYTQMLLLIDGIIGGICIMIIYLIFSHV